MIVSPFINYSRNSCKKTRDLSFRLQKEVLLSGTGSKNVWRYDTNTQKDAAKRKPGKVGKGERKRKETRAR